MVNAEDLLDAINDVNDDIILEADKVRNGSGRPARRAVVIRLLAAAAAVVLLLGAGFIAALKLNLIGGNESLKHAGSEGIMYTDYAGPIFPLTVLEGPTDVEAHREITYDFFPYKEGEASVFVTDSYRLDVRGEGKRRIRLRYPFSGSLQDNSGIVPTIFVNDNVVETDLKIVYTSADTQLDSWLKYKELLKDETADEPVTAQAVSEEPVEVYLFSEFSMPEEVDSTDLMVSISYDPLKTKVLTYGFTGIEHNKDSETVLLYAPVIQSDKACLIVLGEGLKSYDVSLTDVNGEINHLNASKAAVTTHENTMPFFDALTAASAQYYDSIRQDDAEGQAEKLISLLSDDAAIMLFTTAVLKSGSLQTQGDATDYQVIELESVYSSVFSSKHLFCVEFSLELQSDETVRILASMKKNASRNRQPETGQKGSYEIDGYDLVPCLGSAIHFPTQKAVVKNTEQIEIIEQNFGFDLNNQITEVALDLTIEYYYMKIQYTVTQR